MRNNFKLKKISLIVLFAFGLFAEMLVSAEYIFEKAGEINPEQLSIEIEKELGLKIAGTEPDAFLTIDHGQPSIVKIEMLKRELADKEQEALLIIIEKHDGKLPEIGKIPLSARDAEDHSLFYKDRMNERNTYYDKDCNPIPAEWVEEFKAAGVKMFTYDEKMKMKKQKYLDEAKKNTDPAPVAIPNGEK